jgi:hypothetical protein
VKVVEVQKFQRIRKKFSWLFLDLLKMQLVLKGIITEQDWKEIKEDIAVDFIKDSHFSELKESEIMRDRLELLTELDQYVGTYFSRDWVRKNILMQSDEDIQVMTKQIESEKQSGEIEDPDADENVEI